MILIQVFESKKTEYLEKKITGIVDDEKSTSSKSNDSSSIHYVRDDLDENDENDVGTWFHLKHTTKL